MSKPLFSTAYLNTLDPERKLWANVLETAFGDAKSSDTLVGMNACNWFFSEDEEVGSLDWICDILSLDKKKIQEALSGG